MVVRGHFIWKILLTDEIFSDFALKNELFCKKKLAVDSGSRFF